MQTNHWKMEDETRGIVIDKILLNWSLKRICVWQTIIVSIKAKALRRYVVAAISHNDYKDVLINKKSMRHSVYRI